MIKNLCSHIFKKFLKEQNKCLNIIQLNKLSLLQMIHSVMLIINFKKFMK